VVQNILKFGAGVSHCSVLKGKAYLYLRSATYRKDSYYTDLYQRRHEDIFGSVSAIANGHHVICKEKCNDWKSYTEKCISKSISSHVDVITSFYLVMKALYDSIKKLFPPTAPSVPFVMILSVLKGDVPSGGANPPYIRCYNSRIEYIFDRDMMYTFYPVPGSNHMIKLEKNIHRFQKKLYIRSSLYSDFWLGLSIESLKEYTFKLEFRADDLDIEGMEEADRFYQSRVGYVEFSFASLSVSDDKLLSSFRQVARGYS
jgi:hypothetical protein